MKKGLMLVALVLAMTMVMGFSVYCHAGGGAPGDDYVGDWKGYWDGTDSIRIWVRSNPDPKASAAGKMLVQITWNGQTENVVGQVKEDCLQIGRRIKLYADPKNPNKCKAKYYWEGESRSANMKK